MPSLFAFRVENPHMATQRYIIEAEQALEGMSSPRAREVYNAFLYECMVNDERPYDDNRQAWGSLWSNASALVEINPNLATLVEVLGNEFDPDAR